MRDSLSSYKKDVERQSSTVVAESSARSSSCLSAKCLAITLLVIGSILLLAGVLYGLILPGIIDDKISDGSATCTASDIAEESFIDPYGDCDTCVPYYYALHPFTVINAEAYLQNTSSVKLQLKETGPYVYQKFSTKSNVTLHDDNTISYRVTDRYEFVPSRSCESCNETTDTVTAMDIGYLKVMTGAGGQAAFGAALASAVLSATANTTVPPASAWALLAQAGENVQRNLLKVVGGLNSLDAMTMAASLQAMKLITDNDLVAFNNPNLLPNNVATSGLLATRNVRQLSYGYPSVIAGLALVPAGLAACESIKANTNSSDALLFCKESCAEENCPLQRACSACTQAVTVQQYSNTVGCDLLEQTLASFNADIAKKVAESTCRAQCASRGLFCIAPLPGAVQSQSVASDVNILRTGCDDPSVINDYVQYEGLTANPIWSKTHSDSRKNPTAVEMQAFSAISNNCENVTCMNVTGGDGSSFPPSGNSFGGFSSEAVADSRNLYVSQARQNVTIYKSDKSVSLNGVPLTRYSPESNVLSQNEKNANLGTGVPVDGVQNLGYNTGVLAFVSFPFFLHADESLLRDVDILTRDDKLVNNVTEISEEQYGTWVDVEAATGKAFDARKRLMASFAVGVKTEDDESSIMDVTLPELVPNVIVPMYWGEETATASDSLINKYKSAKSLSKSAKPVLIAGAVAGFILLVTGVVCCVRYKRSKKN